MIRAAALPGEAPFFFKDLAGGEWAGTAVDMARDIARVWDAKLEFIETSYSGSVLDLQANKVDMDFPLQPTRRGRWRSAFRGAKLAGSRQAGDPGGRAAGWIVGCVHGPARPLAQTTVHKSGTDAVLALQSGRADCVIYRVVQGFARGDVDPTLIPADSGF